MKKSTESPLVKKIVSEVIEASKNNPEALDLINSIINNIGAKPTKFFLMKMTDGTLLNKESAEQMKETAKVIPEFAYESFLGLDFFENAEDKIFTNWLKTLIKPETRPDKITSLFKDLIGFAKTRKERLTIDATDYLHSDVPGETVKENLKVLNQVLDIGKGKIQDINLVNFVTKNVNLV